MVDCADSLPLRLIGEPALEALTASSFPGQLVSTHKSGCGHRGLGREQNRVQPLAGFLVSRSQCGTQWRTENDNSSFTHPASCRDGHALHPSNDMPLIG